MREVIDFTSQSMSMARAKLEHLKAREDIREIIIHHHQVDSMNMDGFQLVEQDTVDRTIISHYRRETR